jgi:hypothetical protein
MLPTGHLAAFALLSFALIVIPPGPPARGSAARPDGWR